MNSIERPWYPALCPREVPTKCELPHFDREENGLFHKGTIYFRIREISDKNLKVSVVYIADITTREIDVSGHKEPTVTTTEHIYAKTFNLRGLAERLQPSLENAGLAEAILTEIRPICEAWAKEERVVKWDSTFCFDTHSFMGEQL